MKSKLSFAIVLVLLCALLPASGNFARARQEQDRNPGLDRLFDLTSYQGLEEIPYRGRKPIEDLQMPSAPGLDVPYSHIVFQSYRNESDWNIFLADGSGGNQTQLTWDTSADIHPRLNRGCTKIVFASNRSGNYDIYTMNLDGSAVTQLTTNDRDDVYPAWSPDGNSIVFQAYRDGNPEIYIMNADGNNQTRLTQANGYDGTPAWSPDGRIVFSSDRLGTGGIWVMNRDGSGLTQLADQAYSIYPAWSPDGSQIAYSADQDGDGWYEMWVTSADGSSQHQLSDMGTQTDIWVRSWSPENSYIAFTGITYVYYQGNWYWTTAYLKGYTISNGAVSDLISNDTEWHPDWQSTDVLPPTSSMAVLPAQSPALFQVNWSGYDNRPTGLRHFDVQVRDGEAGTWTDWKYRISRNASAFLGIGGHTYYFRVRATDNHYNTEPWPADYQTFTTVESQPPSSSVITPPVYLQNGGTIGWAGTDPGGSGIRSYDVQYRDLADMLWTDWLAGTFHEQHFFNAQVRHSYDFRVRATDNAWNLGNWSSAQSSTTLCNYALVGVISDSTGIPVTHASITLNPGAATQWSEDGKYASCALADSSTYAATWTKDGYGNLPLTNFNPFQKPSGVTVLPPANNVVKSWGFESGIFTPDWVASGNVPPVITETARHTGEYGGMLGANIEYGRVITIGGSLSRSYYPQLGFSNDGTIHVIWNGVTYVPNAPIHGLYYAQRDPYGNWSEPELIWSESPVGDTLELFHARLLMDGDKLHVFWADRSTERILYIYRSEDGSWSEPNTIAGPYDGNPLQPNIDAVISQDGEIHLTWNISSEHETSIYYAYRDSYGQWFIPQRIATGTYSFEENPIGHKIAVDRRNEVSLVFSAHPYGDYIAYTRRGANGVWSQPISISTQINPAGEQLGIGPDGTVYALWANECNIPLICENAIIFAQRTPDGVWSIPEIVPGVSITWESLSDILVVTADGLAYVFGFDFNTPATRYVWRSQQGVWSLPVDLDDQYGSYMVARTDSLGRLYAMWITRTENELFYTRQELNGAWLPARSIYQFPEYPSRTELGLDPGGKIHVIWPDPNTYNVLYYWGPKIASQDYVSSLSQSLLVPVAMTAPMLSYLYHLEGVTEDSNGSFNVQISAGDNSTTIYSSAENTEDWSHQWHDLAPWIGQAVTLTFSLDGAAGYPYAWADLDEVTVGSAHPDAWVAGLRTAGLPGEQASFSIGYGNRGHTLGSSGIITVTLPASLTFVSASIDPLTSSITATNVITWDLGDLPAGSGPSYLVITVTLAADLQLGISLEIPVAIAPAAGELELVNNTSQVVLFIGRQVFLPVTAQ